MKNPYIDNYF